MFGPFPPIPTSVATRKIIPTWCSRGLQVEQASGDRVKFFNYCQQYKLEATETSQVKPGSDYI
jgi:hypothetical protein